MSYQDLEESVYGGKPIDCFHFRRGTTDWFITSGDRALELPGIGVFEPAAIRAGGLELRDEDDSGSIEIELPRTSPIVAAYIPYLPAEKTWLRVYQVHRGAEDDPICTFIGSIASVAFRGASIAHLQCLSLLGNLSRRVPTLAYTVQCNRPLYGPGCGVDPESFRDSVAVDDVDGATVTSSQFALHADGWFAAGWLQRTNGERRFIVSHTGSAVVLMSPFPDLAVGETVSAYAGCDLTRETCIERFGNAANFFGFEWIPTRDPHKQRIG